jgi:hypothetical protein
MQRLFNHHHEGVMNRLSLPAAILLAIVVSACGATYTPPQTYSFINARTIDKPFDEVWGRTVQWFALSGNPVKNMDRSSGFIATDYNLGVNDLEACDCGQGGLNLVQREELSERLGNFNVFLQKVEENKTRVTVTVKYFAIFDKSVNSGRGGYQPAGSTKRECNSTGKLEGRILAYLAE